MSVKTDTLRSGARGRSAGVTLIELVISVVIAAILTSAAYGTYTKHTMRAHRSVAQQFMLEVVNREELYVLDARAYTDKLGTDGLGLYVPNQLTGRYTINIALTAGPPPGYVVTATPIGPQVDDGLLILTSTGDRSPPDKWER